MGKVTSDSRRGAAVDNWLQAAPNDRSLAEVVSLLRAGAGGASGGTDAEEADVVAGYASAGGLSVAELNDLWRDGALRRRVASVARLAASELAEGSVGRSGWLGRRWLGVAALLALSVSAALLAPYVRGTAEDAPDHRAGTIEVADVELVGPDGVVATAPRVEWKPVLGADLYEVEVTTADGRMIFLGRTGETDLQIPSGALTSGVRYFYRVRARIEVSRWVSSEFREIVVR